MAINEKDILDIVLREGYVSQEDFDKALHREKKGNASALDYLLENNVLSLDLVGQAMAEYYGVFFHKLVNISAPARFRGKCLNRKVRGSKVLLNATYNYPLNLRRFRDIFKKVVFLTLFWSFVVDFLKVAGLAASELRAGGLARAE